MYFPRPAINENDLAIIERGDTAEHSIEKGQYVSWKGKLGKAKSAILQGATLDDSLFSYETDGVINELSNNFTLVDTKTGTTAISIPANAKELFVEVTLNNNTSVLVTFFIPTSTIDGERSYRAGYSFTGTYMGTAIIKVDASTVKLDEAYLNNNVNVTSTSVIKLYAK